MEIPSVGSDYFFITDSEKLLLILSNLLSNAIKYSHAGGEVKISAERVEKKLLLTVQDKGIGFDKVAEEEIFNRFTQLDSGLTRSYGGHGLGLSIARAAVELMHGDIKVSGKKNSGCMVKVSFSEVEKADQVFDQSDAGNETFFSTTEKF